MSQFELQGKIAIVTGGGTETGKAIALKYAEAGADVVVASRKQENLDKVAAEIKSMGRESLAVVTDITKPEQVDNMIKQTLARFGRLDIMVNNAGGALTFKGMEGVSLEEWNANVTLNLTGTFLCSVAAGKVMIEQKKGKIINISSVSGVRASPMLAPYGAAKAGVNNLTRSLAAEWARHNINVNAIVPGVINTEQQRRGGIVPPERNEDGTPVPPTLFPPGPDDVADLAVFLASAASDHISGEAIPIRYIGGI